MKSLRQIHINLGCLTRTIKMDVPASLWAMANSNLPATRGNKDPTVYG